MVPLSESRLSRVCDQLIDELNQEIFSESNAEQKVKRKQSKIRVKEDFEATKPKNKVNNGGTSMRVSRAERSTFKMDRNSTQETLPSLKEVYEALLSYKSKVADLEKRNSELVRENRSLKFKLMKSEENGAYLKEIGHLVEEMNARKRQSERKAEVVFGRTHQSIKRRQKA